MMIKFLDGSAREIDIHPGADLRGANLIGAYLDGANLSGAARGVATGFKKAKELPLP